MTCPPRRFNACAHIQGPCWMPWHGIVQLLVLLCSHIADRLAPVLEEKLRKWLSTTGEAIAAAKCTWNLLANSSIAKQSLCQCMPQPHLGRPLTFSSPWSTSAALPGMGTSVGTSHQARQSIVALPGPQNCRLCVPLQITARTLDERTRDAESQMVHACTIG